MIRILIVFLVFLSALGAAGCSPSMADNLPEPTAVLATVPPIPSVENTPTAEPANATFSIGSPLIRDNGAIISQFTCDGPELSPPLTWKDAPNGVQSYALIVDDPDAPGGSFVHWILYDIPADRTELPQNIAKSETVAGIGVQGKNSAGKSHYNGPCPPAGEPHHYNFTLYALDTRLFAPSGTDRADLEKAMRGHILGQATITGIYQRVQAQLNCCGASE